jgi:hypothetical protein
MSDTRKRALEYLQKVIGEVPEKLVSASKFFKPEESWTQKETWWFNLPIKKIKGNKKKYYYLLGARKKGEKGFVIVEVPNRFLITNLRGLETRYDDKVILHLAAYKDNWLIDERGKDRLNFSRFEIK